MKIAFIGDNDLPSVENDSRFAKEHGFTALEYNYWGGFKDLTAETVKQMAAIHKKYGVRACMLGIWGWNHLSPDPKTRAEAHAMLERAIAFAKILRADVLVTGAGDIPGEPAGRKVAEFLEVFPPILQRIQKAGLQAAFYAVHGASFLDSLEAYERVWEHLPELKIKFDPANWRHHGDDYLAVVQRYGHKIGYVHLKEHLYKDGQLVSQPAAGMGDIEWGKVMAFLYEHNYDGWLSIEPHGPIWSRGAMREKLILLTRKYISQFMV
ncbi:MAG: sugar phosphate isomerase/epimerase family protein [Planctomycetota bacterium]